LQLALQGKEFNDILVESIDETITALLSQEVLNALYVHLEKVHSISKDEVPYRLETLFSTLQKTFGVTGSKTISRAVAKKFYAQLQLPFPDLHGNLDLTLTEYVEEAKIKLQERVSKP
jgi:hypothetical protein